ncbi:MAG: hypothetical protein U0531_21050 [Dehalococcoidia bacterium]
MTAWADAARHGRVFRAEYRFVARDGAETWVLGQATAEPRGGGDGGYVGAITDITEQKFSEARTLESEERLRAALVARARAPSAGTCAPPRSSGTRRLIACPARRQARRAVARSVHRPGSSRGSAGGGRVVRTVRSHLGGDFEMTFRVVLEVGLDGTTRWLDDKEPPTPMRPAGRVQTGSRRRHFDRKLVERERERVARTGARRPRRGRGGGSRQR